MEVAHGDDAGNATGPVDVVGRLRTLIAQFERVQAGWREHAGLNANERLVLTHLVTSGALTAAELTRRIGMTSAALTTLVDRLEDGGHVRRVPDQQDRRRVLLYPTKAAVRGAHEILGAAADDVQATFDRYRPEQQAAIVDFLERASTAFERQAASRHEAPARPG